MVVSLVCLFVYAGMQGGLKGFTQGKSSGNFWSCTFCPGFSGPKCGPVSGPAFGARSRFTGGSRASALGAETLALCVSKGISPDSTAPRMGLGSCTFCPAFWVHHSGPKSGHGKLTNLCEHESQDFHPKLTNASMRIHQLNMRALCEQQRGVVGAPPNLITVARVTPFTPASDFRCKERGLHSCCITRREQQGGPLGPLSGLGVRGSTCRAAFFWSA